MTKRQEEVYNFVVDRITTGSPPTLKEICEAFNFKSPGGASCHLKALQKKGLLERQTSISRGIRLPQEKFLVKAKILKVSNNTVHLEIPQNNIQQSDSLKVLVIKET